MCVNMGKPVDISLSFSVPIAVFLFSFLLPFSFLLFLPLPVSVLRPSSHISFTPYSLSPFPTPHGYPTCPSRLAFPAALSTFSPLSFHLPPPTPQMIDGEAFLLLTQADIVKIMSVKLGPALKIYNAILMFKNADDTLK